MTRFSRLSIVILLLAAISFRLAAVYTMTGDPSRAEHVSRSTVHPAEVRVGHLRGSRERLAQHVAHTPSADVSDAASVVCNPLTDRRYAPRDAASYPPYWSSVHLTI